MVKFFMKSCINKAIYLLMLCGSVSASVRIIENSTTRLVFQWELGSIDTVSISDSGKLSTSLAFGGENIMLGADGEPAIPGFSVFAGMPLSGNVRVIFVPGPTRTLNLHHALRKIRWDGGKPVVTPNAIQFSQAWISNPRYTWLKNMRATHLVINPFRYDARALTAEVLQSGECAIVFPAGSTASGARPAMTAYQNMLKCTVLNYDVAAAAWTPAAKKSLRKTADPFPFEYGRQLLTFTIGDGHSGMNEVTIKENGILKITGSQLLRLFHASAGSIGMRNVSLYGSVKGKLPMTGPAFDAIPAGVTEVPLFRCDRNGNGLIDSDDYFLAYVTGLSDWGYDPLMHDFSFALDDYDDNRHYWLTLNQSGAGATVDKFAQPTGSTQVVDYFINRVMFRQPNYQPVEYENGAESQLDVVKWIWVKLSPLTSSFDYTLDLPGVDTTYGGSLQFTTFDGRFSRANVSATVAGVTLSTLCGGGADYPVALWGDRHLHLEYARENTTYFWQLENMRAAYRRPLAVATDSLVRMHVFSFNDSGVRSFRLTPTGSGTLFIFRIPPNDGAVTLIDTIRGGTPFTWNDSDNTGARYFLCSETGFFTLSDAEISAPSPRLSGSANVVSNLRDVTNSADYLIVTHPDFLSEAERLASHKANFGFSRPRIVSINDIYTDFAGGNFDPVALRNFLAFAARNWDRGSALDYVVLMGAGHTDFKRIKTAEINYIPPAELNDLCIEDFYAKLTPGEFWNSGELSVALGRLSCQTKSEAATLVDKIIEVENIQTADWGSWRNSILFVADDDMQGSRDDPIRGSVIGHHASSERTAMITESLRPSMNIRKVYLFDYPWNAIYQKPEASRAIVNEINTGVGYVNFFGHGSDAQWTDESVLTANSVPQLYNSKRYPIVSSYSCGVGRFDKPDNLSLSEALVKAPGAGAIAAFSSTRSASATNNEVLSQNVYALLFYDSLPSPTFGMAVLGAKFRCSDGNSMVYALFGDPSLRLVTPRRRVQLELRDMSGNPQSDTLKATQQITIRGSVVDENGVTDRNFGANTPAFVQLGIFNPSTLTSRRDGGNDPDSVRWYRPGKPLFSAKTAVRNGLFEQTAILPPNITFDKCWAKLTAYAGEGPTAGLGCRSSLYFHGTCITCSQNNDSTGPRITIRPVYDMESMRSNSVSFSDRIVSSLPLKCEIAIDDQSGINVVDNGPDQGLTMEIPGVVSRRNINYKFQFVEGDYRKGSAVMSFEENSLKTGRYGLEITAQDLRGNVSHNNFTLEITDVNSLSLDHVFNTPNPMRMGENTRFFFYPSRTTTQNYYPPMEFHSTIKIYSLGGKLLKIIRNARNGETWNGRDQTGYPLPPNIYLFQLTADDLTQDKQVKSKIQKLVIHPPRR
jgi:hypothetical protein